MFRTSKVRLGTLEAEYDKVHQQLQRLQAEVVSLQETLRRIT